MAWLTDEEIAQYDLRYNDGLSEERYDPEQPRDDSGKWSGGGGGAYAGTGIGGGPGGPRPAYAPTSADQKRWEAQGVTFSKSWTPQDQLKHEAAEPDRIRKAQEQDVPSTMMDEKEKAAWTAAHPAKEIASGLGKEQGDVHNYDNHQLEEHIRRMHGEAVKLNPSRAELEAAHAEHHATGLTHVHSTGAVRPDTHYAPLPNFGKMPIPGYEDYQTDEGHGSVPGSGR